MKTIIDASGKSLSLDLRELVKYKDLFYTLTKRDLKVRYTQSYFGFLWVLAQPVVNIAFAYFILGAISTDMSQELKLVYSSSAVALWTYFSFVFDQSGGSIIAAQQMIKKIYFPRLIIPLSKALLGMIDFFVAMMLLILVVIAFGYTPSNNIIYAIPFILISVISALGMGLWISALSVRYRDFKYMSPFLLRVGYMISPVIYPAHHFTSEWSEVWETIYFLNPMAGAIEGFRWSITGIGEISYLYGISGVVGVLLFIFGLYYFKSVERKMADLV